MQTLKDHNYYLVECPGYSPSGYCIAEYYRQRWRNEYAEDITEYVEGYYPVIVENLDFEVI